MSAAAGRETAVFRPLDWELNGFDRPPERPWAVQLKAVARGPGGAQLEVPGYYRGEGSWCVRFAAPVPGSWRLETLATEPALAGATLAVEAGPAAHAWARGPVQRSPLHFGHFQHADGTPHFLLGYELNWLWAIDQTAPDLARTEQLLDPLAGAGFNHVMVNSYAYDTRWCPGRSRERDYGPPELHPWPGYPEEPDYTRLNPGYFEHFDRMMWALWERGMVAHIYFKVYNKQVEWPERRSPAEELFFDHLVARYQAFPNVVWDFSKESYNEPDKEYIAYRLDRIRERDAYGRLVTVHDDNCFVGDPRRRRAIDFITDQNHAQFHETILWQREAYGLPVVNAEFGYEHGPGGLDDYTYGRRQSPEEVLTRAYEVVTAGGYPVHYYTNHAWDVIEWDEVAMLVPAYGHLYRWITSFPWYALEPRRDLGTVRSRVLTDGRDHLALFAAAGRGVLVVPGRLAGRTATGEWMEIMSGERRAAEVAFGAPGGRQRLPSPFGDAAAVLYLRVDP